MLPVSFETLLPFEVTALLLMALPVTAGLGLALLLKLSGVRSAGSIGGALALLLLFALGGVSVADSAKFRTDIESHYGVTLERVDRDTLGWRRPAEGEFSTLSTSKEEGDISWPVALGREGNSYGLFIQLSDGSMQELPAAG